jgi:hypothetical protein
MAYCDMMSCSLVNGRKFCLIISVPRSIGTYPPTYTASCLRTAEILTPVAVGSTSYLRTGEILTPVAVGSSDLGEFKFVSWTTV